MSTEKKGKSSKNAGRASAATQKSQSAFCKEKGSRFLIKTCCLLSKTDQMSFFVSASSAQQIGSCFIMCTNVGANCVRPLWIAASSRPVPKGSFHMPLVSSTNFRISERSFSGEHSSPLRRHHKNILRYSVLKNGIYQYPTYRILLYKIQKTGAFIVVEEEPLPYGNLGCIAEPRRRR